MGGWQWLKVDGDHNVPVFLWRWQHGHFKVGNKDALWGNYASLGDTRELGSNRKIFGSTITHFLFWYSLKSEHWYESVAELESNLVKGVEAFTFCVLKHCQYGNGWLIRSLFAFPET